MNTSQENCIKIGWEKKTFQILEIDFFSASFGQFYIWNSKRKRKSALILLKVLNTIHLKKNIEIGWKIKILYTFQLCKILELGPLSEIK